MILFAPGGKGKTTMMIDAVFHFASARNWLDFPVNRPLNVLVIENEGPREPFRMKLEAKRKVWPHEITGEIHIATFAWSGVTLKNAAHVERLRSYIDEHEIDLVVGDPLDSLGLEGVGSPEDTRAFVKMLVATGLNSKVAYFLLHHSKKSADEKDEADEISGAWSGRPDAQLKLSKLQGNKARLSFPKWRWSRRGTQPAFVLTFDPDTETFTKATEEEDEERDLVLQGARHSRATRGVIRVADRRGGSRARSVSARDGVELARGQRGVVVNEQAIALDLRRPKVIIRTMLTFDRAVDDFLNDCQRRGFTPRTIATYQRTYDEFSRRLPRDRDVNEVTTEDVRRYLATKGHLAPGTVAGVEAHLASLFKWLYFDAKIETNPIDRLPRTRRSRPEDLDVTTVQPTDVPRLIDAAESWSERLALAILVYMGPRRRAVARLRLTDYDRLHGRLRFREKGDKIIWKPVPNELRALLDEAIDAGAIEDYLVPPEGYLQRSGDRDDRVIWRLVKRVAARAGVDAHVHALRGAFAAYYLSLHPGDVEALKELLGHRSISTTQVYLRKFDKETAMERVRSLSWDVAKNGNGAATESSQSAAKVFESLAGVGAGGFEPP